MVIKLMQGLLDLLVYKCPSFHAFFFQLLMKVDHTCTDTMFQTISYTICAFVMVINLMQGILDLLIYNVCHAMPFILEVAA